MNAFCAFALAFCLASPICLFGGTTAQSVSAAVNKVGSWQGGGQYQIAFTNTDASKTVCYVRFSLTTSSGTTVSGQWNMDKVSGSADQNTLASYINIAPGAKSTDAGFTVNGNGQPSVKVLETKFLVNGVCGGSGGGSGGGNNPTTTTTTSKPGGGGGNNPTTTTTTAKPSSGGGGGGSGGCCPNGNLAVKGTNLVGSDGQPVQLRGMSLFSSQHSVGNKFFNAQTVKCLKCSWNANIVRAPIGVQDESSGGGYLAKPDLEYQRELAVVQAAIDNCMYVLVDWHYTDSQEYVSQATDFFSKISKVCAGKCNCLYETYNEPTSNSWSGDLKAYHEKMINVIRANDKNGVIIAGTPTWDQAVDQAAADPITDQKNIMYTLHFYAGTHKQDLRDKAQGAINKGLPLFVTEYGTTQASGDGTPDLAETQKWYDFLDKNKVSYINWAVDDKPEQSAALKQGSTPADVCSDSALTQSGQSVKQMLKSKNPKPSGC